MLTKERVIEIAEKLQDLDIFIHSESIGILVMFESLDWILRGHNSFEVRINDSGVHIYFK